MFDQIKKEHNNNKLLTETKPSNVQQLRKPSEKINNHSRGAGDYPGALNPVERLHLLQRVDKRPQPVYSFEELSPPIKITLSCDGNKIVKSRFGPIKFRCTVSGYIIYILPKFISVEIIFIIFVFCVCASVPTWGAGDSQ